jgi:hypothetical protein
MKHIVQTVPNLQEVIQLLDHLWLFKSSKTLHKILQNRNGSYDVHWSERDSEEILDEMMIF